MSRHQEINLLSSKRVNKIGVSLASIALVSTFLGGISYAHSDSLKSMNRVDESSVLQTDNKSTENPQILSIQLDKQAYAPGDTVNAEIKVKEKGTLTDVSIGFSNDTNVGIAALAEIADSSHFKRLQDDIWVVNIPIQIPEKIGDTSFTFAAVTADNELGNGDTVAPGLARPSIDTSNLKFKVVNKGAQMNVDTQAPIIEGIEINKEKYHPGDMINATLKIKDTSKLSEVSLGFYNEPFNGQDGIDKFANIENAYQEKEGTWIVPIQLKVPEQASEGEFKFSHVSAIDEFGNSIGITYNLEEAKKFKNVKFSVVKNEIIEQNSGKKDPSSVEINRNEQINTKVNDETKDKQDEFKDTQTVKDEVNYKKETVVKPAERLTKQQEKLDQHVKSEDSQMSSNNDNLKKIAENDGNTNKVSGTKNKLPNTGEVIQSHPVIVTIITIILMVTGSSLLMYRRKKQL